MEDCDLPLKPWGVMVVSAGWQDGDLWRNSFEDLAEGIGISLHLAFLLILE